MKTFEDWWGDEIPNWPRDAKAAEFLKEVAKVAWDAGNYMTPIPRTNAPRDGTRILLKYKTSAYINDSIGWGFTGEKWEECRWVSDKERTGSEPHWQPWCGNARTQTTQHIRDEDTIAWLPLP